MITVEVDVQSVERRLGEGRLACPGCGGRLRGWGRARERGVRERDAVVTVQPRRARCQDCSLTHVLLPVTCWSRRADGVEVIGEALDLRAQGFGYRKIAGALGRTISTVRGWLRRAVARLEAMRVFFTGWGVRIAIDMITPVVVAGPGHGAGDTAWADAVGAVQACHGALVQRFAVTAMTKWQVAAAMTSGALLGPSWPVFASSGGIHTS